ncbi:MAG: DNA adenine methylase [Oligoflexia bacterium]|nr:DNA adenine methylase [Oligoflexia bacterium]
MDRPCRCPAGCCVQPWRLPVCNFQKKNNKPRILTLLGDFTSRRRAKVCAWNANWYNLKGKFNTPFGRYARPYFPENELKFFFEKSKNAEFVIQDFETTMNSAVKGDVLYCDPPYTPLSATANFTCYSAGGFTHEQQLRLARLAEKLSGRGVPVIILIPCQVS